MEQDAISIVIVGYETRIEDFGKLLGEINGSFVVKSDLNIPTIGLPPNAIEQIRYSFPIKYVKDNIVVTYAPLEQKIIVESLDIKINSLIEVIDLAKKIIEKIDTNLVSAIGFNFSKTFSQNKKLQLLSDAIGQFSLWGKNKGFQLVIPIKIEDNLDATYFIAKLKEENDADNENKTRIYILKTNYNLNIGLIKDKNIFNNFLDKTKNEFYAEIQNSLKEILKIGKNDNEQG